MMPQYVVKQPNGLLAVFSTVVDDFTFMDCGEAEMRAYWVKELGEKEGNAKVHRGLIDSPECSTDGILDGGTRWTDALNTISIMHGFAKAEKRRERGERKVGELAEEET